MPNLPVIDLDATGGGNSQGSSYVGTFLNYSDLVANFPTANFGDFAVVENSQGTAWLPWTVGGTYYPEGTYYWDGTEWISNVEDIAEELQNIIDNANTQGLPDVLAIENRTIGNDVVFSNNDRSVAENGGSFLDLRSGPNYAFDGVEVGGSVAGFTYNFAGDLTFAFSIGTEVRVRNTQNGSNDGVHTLTVATFDGVNTRIQWSGIVTELSSPYGSLIIPTDGYSTLGQDEYKFEIQDLGGGFTITTMLNKQSEDAFTEFYSFFGYQYIWAFNTEDVDPLKHRRGGFTVHNTLGSSGAVTLGDVDSPVTSMGVNRVTFAIDSKNIGVGGAKYIFAKTDEAFYSRRFIINHEGVGVDGHTSETVIDCVKPTADRTWLIPDKSDTFAGLKDISASKGNFIKGILDVATLTATVDDWSPAGFDADTDLIRVDVNANNRQITGIIAPAVGVNRILGVNNTNGASFDIRFMHNNGSSLAQNRFLLRDNGNKAIKPNETAWFWYDHSVQRWKPFNRVG